MREPRLATLGILIEVGVRRDVELALRKGCRVCVSRQLGVPSSFDVPIRTKTDGTMHIVGFLNGDIAQFLETHLSFGSLLFSIIASAQGRSLEKKRHPTL